MSTQSGISASEELLSAFQDAQTSDVRALKVSIEQERLVPSSTTSVAGSETEDFAAIPDLLEPDTPCYILVKLDASSSSSAQTTTNTGSDGPDDKGWLLATFVPDQAPVRSKMLYSSTKATLSRQLGDGKFRYTLFASTPDELSSDGYKRFLAHQNSTAPLTSREQEMADIREAEGVEVVGSSVRRNHAGAQIGMPWDDSVDEAFQALKDGQKKVVQLAIDTSKERITLLGTPDELTVPANDPSYTFYAHHSGIVFIYCCPDTSPIRGRMIYSANCQPIVQDAKKRGVEVVKKMETSTPSEITSAAVDAEFATSEAEQTSRSATPTASFARPARPGRKR